MSSITAGMNGHVRTRLILARHGQTDYNREARLQGQVDIPLNAVGRKQARALAAAMVEQEPDVIVSSPLARAHDTALEVGKACGIDVVVDEAFLERGFGPWEGLRGEEIRSRWPQEHALWREHRSVPGLGIEDRPDVARRVADRCHQLMAENTGMTVLVVGHGAATTLGITELLGLDTDTFRGIGGLQNCHRSVLEPLYSDPAGERMRLVSHNIAPDFI